MCFVHAGLCAGIRERGTLGGVQGCKPPRVFTVNSHDKTTASYVKVLASAYCLSESGGTY